MIGRHCEEIYSNFKPEYKSWYESYHPRLSNVTINKKWRQLKQSNYITPETKVKTSADYNNLVDDIVQLTGYNSSKNDFNDLLELAKSMKIVQNQGNKESTEPSTHEEGRKLDNITDIISKLSENLSKQQSVQEISREPSNYQLNILYLIIAST